jgi:thioredoxin-like negative regulator of GroEL
MATVKELNDSNFSSELAQHKIAIVDFYASWCGSCRLFAPSYEKVATANTEIPFFKVDGDEHPSTREGLSIDNLPFVAIFENGKPVGGLNISKEDALNDLVAKVRKKAGL